MVLAPIILTAERSKVVDFPFPWNLGSYNMIIPSPEVLTNIGAPWKPFSVEVNNYYIVVFKNFTQSIFLGLAFTSCVVHHHYDFIKTDKSVQSNRK